MDTDDNVAGRSTTATPGPSDDEMLSKVQLDDLLKPLPAIASTCRNIQLLCAKAPCSNPR